MKNTVKIILILLVAANICLPFKSEEYFGVQIKKEGWELPKLDRFTLSGDKRACREPFKKCFEEFYEPKENVIFRRIFINRILFSNEIPGVEISSIDFIIEGLTITYYKSRPFCLFFGGTQGWYKSYYVVLDMDLDGIYELNLQIPKATEFFFKYSPKVDEEDRYRGSINIGGKEIK